MRWNSRRCPWPLSLRLVRLRLDLGLRRQREVEIGQGHVRVRDDRSLRQGFGTTAYFLGRNEIDPLDPLPRRPVHRVRGRANVRGAEAVKRVTEMCEDE